MREYITELSRYIIPALMAVYTLCSFACLVEGTAWKQGGIPVHEKTGANFRLVSGTLEADLLRILPHK